MLSGGFLKCFLINTAKPKVQTNKNKDPKKSTFTDVLILLSLIVSLK
jgi:hypothetical protein